VGITGLYHTSLTTFSAGTIHVAGILVYWRWKVAWYQVSKTDKFQGVFMTSDLGVLDL